MVRLISNGDGSCGGCIVDGVICFIFVGIVVVVVVVVFLLFCLFDNDGGVVG